MGDKYTLALEIGWKLSSQSKAQLNIHENPFWFE